MVFNKETLFDDGFGLKNDVFKERQPHSRKNPVLLTDVHSANKTLKTMLYLHTILTTPTFLRGLT